MSGRVVNSDSAAQRMGQDIQEERAWPSTEMKPHMTSIWGQEYAKIRATTFVDTVIGIAGDPGIVFGVKHHNRNLDLPQTREWGGPPVIFGGTGESVSRCRKKLVIFKH